MNVRILLFATFILSLLTGNVPAQDQISKVWVADNGDGTYKNPVLFADYSDPDAIRVGDDYYLISSSFNCVPALPILHSNDLVNWKIVGHVFSQQKPLDVFNKPQHGNGVWAPAIRYHNGEFYIYYPDPDYGIYLVKAKTITGPWSEPLLVKSGKGLIDPCPLWDDDGKAYLVHGWAGSRAGFKSILTVCGMSPEGTALDANDVMVFDGHAKHPTLEGPKFYKRNGYYYIMAPAGGVSTGWQLVLRSKNVFGPYDEKVVMDQGNTTINGPHQGAWVETQKGESWFLHFQDMGPYGRVVHLQPMLWVNDWPVIGADPDGDGKGEPVLRYKKPNMGKTYPIATPVESDEFNSTTAGLQWQWHANPQNGWAFTTPYGYLKMFAIPQPEGYTNLWDIPNLLLQKLPALEFTATTKITFTPNTKADGEKCGLVVMGMDYTYLKVQYKNKQLWASQVTCTNAPKKSAEIESELMPLSESTFYLRVKVTEGAMCAFSFSTDGKQFTRVGDSFHAIEGRWIGAKMGLFCSRTTTTNDAGFIDVDWFRVEK